MLNGIKPFRRGRQPADPKPHGLGSSKDERITKKDTFPSFPEGEAVAAATEEGTQVAISREISLKRYNVKHSESVGADTSRPKANERELYRQTAQSRHPAGRQIAAPYELRRFFRLPFNQQLRPITFRAADIRPYGLACTIQRALNKEPRAVSPLQSALRAASFPQGKLLEVAITCFHSTQRSVPQRCGSANCRPLRTQKIFLLTATKTARHNFPESLSTLRLHLLFAGDRMQEKAPAGLGKCGKWWE